MRVCINAAAANQGGAVTYLLNLLPQLARSDDDDRYLLIAPDETLDRLSDTLRDARFEVERYTHPPGRFAQRLAFDQLRVPRIARRFEADLLFSSNGFGTFVKRRPEALLVRNAVYFSKGLEERLDELGRSLRDIRLRRALSRLSMRTATGVLFPTRAMQKRVGRYAPLSGKPLRAVHYGFDREQFFSEERPDDEVLAPLRVWRESGRRILLYVSGYAVHKNFETAIEALARRLEAGADVGLALTAEWKPFGEMAEFEAMLQRIRELGIEDHVAMLGQQPWRHLHAVYAAADIHLWPSLLESFGHPMLEAMASGLPSVAADTEVNREILADAAVYFDPLDAAACARGIERIENEPALAEGLRLAARTRCERFTWTAHATELRDFFATLAPSAR